MKTVLKQKWIASQVWPGTIYAITDPLAGVDRVAKCGTGKVARHIVKLHNASLKKKGPK